MLDAHNLPSLILLPGLDGTGKLFVRFVEALGSGIDVQIVRYPPDRPLGYEELEQHVRAELPQDRPFVLLAESFSGPIAIRIAAAGPAGLVGVVLCGTFARNPYPLLGWASSLAFLVPVKSLPRWVRAPLMWGSKDAVSVPAQADRAIANVADSVVRRRIAALLTVDATESLGRIKVPTLIVYARNDRVVRFAATRWLSAHLPAARIVAIDGPHLLLQARYAECAAAITLFLRKGLPFRYHRGPLHNEGESMHRPDVKPIPDGMHTVTPHLICAGAADALEFYKKAFGAKEISRLPGPGGRLMHAAMTIGDSTVMLADDMPQHGAPGPKALKGSPVFIHLYVEDVDAFTARAVAAGATVTMPVSDMFWGDRYGQMEDPFGHRWSVATHVKDMTPDEMKAAMGAMSRPPPA